MVDLIRCGTFLATDNGNLL